MSRTSARFVLMKAENNPNGIPRVRKTWRIDPGILHQFTSLCEKCECAESVALEAAMKWFMKTNSKEDLKKLKK